MKESPIFSKTYDLLLWLIPLTVKFPRSHRFVLAEAIQRTALQFQEQLIEAGLENNRQEVLGIRISPWQNCAFTYVSAWTSS